MQVNRNFQIGDAMSSVSDTRSIRLKAAHEPYSCKGFQESSALDIARQASVAKVTFFRHITTKETPFDVTVDRLTAAAAFKRF